MKIPFSNYFLCCLIISIPVYCTASDGKDFKPASVSNDSSHSVWTIENKLPFRIYQENLALSTSFNLAKNAAAQKASFFQFSEYYSLGLRVKSVKSETDISIDSEIGYKYYLDSIWEQTEDRLAVSFFRFGSLERRFRYTYSIQLNTSVLPVYESRPENNESRTTLKSGGFFNPGELNAAYGFSWCFWDISYLNVSLASIKLQSASKYVYAVSGTDPGSYRREWKIDYGFSVNLRINHQLTKRLKWINQSRLFFNSPDKNNLRLSINNQLEFKLISFLKVSAYTRLDYFPIIRREVQLIQEFRLGLEWILSP